MCACLLVEHEHRDKGANYSITVRHKVGYLIAIPYSNCIQFTDKGTEDEVHGADPVRIVMYEPVSD